MLGDVETRPTWVITEARKPLPWRVLESSVSPRR